MAKRLSVSESPVARRHTFSSMLDEPLEETIASDMETVTEGNTAESNDVSPATNGKNVFSVPVLRNIEKFIYYNCRDQIVAEEIKRESCLLTNHTAWWLNQTDFLVDVDTAARKLGSAHGMVDMPVGDKNVERLVRERLDQRPEEADPAPGVQQGGFFFSLHQIHEFSGVGENARDAVGHFFCSEFGYCHRDHSHTVFPLL